MSRVWVDEIKDRAGTGTPVLTNTPASSDDSAKVTTTAWIRDHVDSRAADQATVEAATSTTDYLTPENIQYSPSITNLEDNTALGALNSSVASMFSFDGSGASGVTSVIWEEGNTHSISKNETGSYTVTLSNAMSDATKYFVDITLAVPSGTTSLKSYTIQAPTTTTFTIVIDSDDGVNVDVADIRVKITGKLA
ncbi:hypothetical protein N9064_00705 [bacterium]|nr:hypothetical protein [bacterium]